MPYIQVTILKLLHPYIRSATTESVILHFCIVSPIKYAKWVFLHTHTHTEAASFMRGVYIHMYAKNYEYNNILVMPALPILPLDKLFLMQSSVYVTIQKHSVPLPYMPIFIAVGKHPKVGMEPGII